MLVIVKSAPDTPEGKRGVKIAQDMAADVVLIQNGVYFGQKERLEGFCGTAYVLDDDCRMRGLKDADMDKGIKFVNYEEIVELLTRSEKVSGMY